MLNFLRYASYALIVLGALNWGLVGAFNFDLVSAIFGYDTLLTNITYILVGVSAIFNIVTMVIHNRECEIC